MRGHVIRALVIVRVTRWVFGSKMLEERLQIRTHFGRGIFLDQQRRRRMPAKERQQPRGNRLRCQPQMHILGDVQQSPPARADAQNRCCLAQD